MLVLWLCSAVRNLSLNSIQNCFSEVELQHSQRERGLSLPLSLSLSLSLLSLSLSLSHSLTLSLSLTLSGNAGIPLRLWIYSACLSRPQCLSFCKDSGLLETGKSYVFLGWSCQGKCCRERHGHVFSVTSQSRSVTAGLVLFVLIWNINRIM